jgi:hypothetical protein
MIINSTAASELNLEARRILHRTHDKHGKADN